MGRVISIADARTRLADGFANLWSKLGTGADRNSRSLYYTPVITQQQIEAAYRSSAITRKGIDLIPFEMTRAGRDWQANADQIEKLEAAEMALGLWPKIETALRTARLHGGAALVLGVRQGSPDMPLNTDVLTANSLRYVIPVSRHQLFAPYGFDLDPESDFFGQPAMWEMRGQRGNTVKIHPSRVITFHGAPLPPGSLSVSQIDQFWGDSLLVSIKSVIDNAETSQAAIATLLHEMKQDIISIPNLTEDIATEGSESRLSGRITAISQLKSMFNVLLLDRGNGENEASGEKWETRQLNFAQCPELLRSFMGLVAGAFDVPVTRFLGESPGGLQSTGKGEHDDLNNAVQAKQISVLKPQLVRVDEILIRSVLGTRPPEIYFTFAPLEEANPKESSDIEYQEAQTVQIYAQTNLIPTDALAKAAANRLNESGRWPGLDIAIEESKQELGDPTIGVDPNAPDPNNPPAAANENTVQKLAKRGTVTNDQAIALLADSSPRSLYVSRELLNAAEVIAWATRPIAQGGAGLTTTVPAGKLHVTEIHSRAPVDWFKVGQYDGCDMSDDGSMTVTPGGPRAVERFGTDGPVVLRFYSSRLIWRHEDFINNGASHDFPDYEPHITLSYQPPKDVDWSKIPPYTGKLVFGPEVFQEVSDNWSDDLTEK